MHRIEGVKGGARGAAAMMEFGQSQQSLADFSPLVTSATNTRNNYKSEFMLLRR